MNKIFLAYFELAGVRSGLFLQLCSPPVHHFLFGEPFFRAEVSLGREWNTNLNESRHDHDIKNAFPYDSVDMQNVVRP